MIWLQIKAGMTNETLPFRSLFLFVITGIKSLFHPFHCLPRSEDRGIRFPKTFDPLQITQYRMLKFGIDDFRRTKPVDKF